MDKKLIDYYQHELHFLKTQGEQLAKEHPHQAKHLNFGHTTVNDPLVKQLIESFAFLTANIHYKLDTQFDKIAYSLVNALASPIIKTPPAMTNLQFSGSPPLEANTIIPSGTTVSTTAKNGQDYFLTSCYPVYLTTLKIQNAKYQKIENKQTLQSSLHFTLKVNPYNATSEHTSVPEKIRIFFNLPINHAHLFYCLLSKHLKKITLHQESSNSFCELSLKHITTAGTHHEIDLVDSSFSWHSLLRDYFHFPQRFFYVDIDNANQHISATNKSLIFNLLFDEYYSQLENSINTSTLILNCTPAVNLFKATGEAIHLDYSQTDYHVIADAQQDINNIDIYQICSLSANDHNGKKIPCLSPFESNLLQKECYLLWQSYQTPCKQLGETTASGYEMFIRLDTNHYSMPPSQQITIIPKLICSNRDLLYHLPTEADFQFHQAHHNSVDAIRCITTIKPANYTANEKNNAMTLLSLSTINRLDLNSSENTLNTIKTIINLYSNREHPIKESTIIDVKVKPCIKRKATAKQQYFCHGYTLTMTINENDFPENNAYLFGDILNSALQQFTSINSFIELTLNTENHEVIHRWPIKL